MLQTFQPTYRSMSSISRVTRPLIVCVATVLWAGITTATCAYFWRADATPGTPAAAPLAIAISDDRLTAYVFLHPKCPCSRATLSELARVLARLERPIDLRVLFEVADPADQSWRSSPLYAQAMRLPAVTIEADTDGILAKKFGVETSGQVIVYDRKGTLVFAGGITGSRGHEGDNVGKDGLTAALNATALKLMAAPVYGCRLPSVSDKSINGKAP